MENISQIRNDHVENLQNFQFILAISGSGKFRQIEILEPEIDQWIIDFSIGYNFFWPWNFPIFFIFGDIRKFNCGIISKILWNFRRLIINYQQIIHEKFDSSPLNSLISIKKFSMSHLYIPLLRDYSPSIFPLSHFAFHSDQIFTKGQ